MPPPIGLVVDYTAIMKYCNATLYLVRQNYTRKNMVKEIENIFKMEKNKNIFIVYNDARSMLGYSYGYGYNYGYGYGYRYGYDYYDEDKETNLFKTIKRKIVKVIT